MKRRDFLRALVGVYASVVGMAIMKSQDSSQVSGDEIKITTNKALKSGDVFYTSGNGLFYHCTVDDKPMGKIVS